MWVIGADVAQVSSPECRLLGKEAQAVLVFYGALWRVSVWGGSVGRVNKEIKERTENKVETL